MNGDVAESGSSAESYNFNTALALGTDGSMHVSSGTGHWQQSSDEFFGYGGGGSYSDTVTQNTGNQSEGTSYSQTTSESLSEWGGHSASSATSMDWVRDDSGWRLSAYSGSDGGESHAGYGYAYSQGTQTASWSGDCYNGNRESSSTEVTQSIGESYGYGYSRQFSGSDVGYGNMTITGTGSGSGWANGYDDYDSEGTTTDSTAETASGYAYYWSSSGWDNATDTNGYGYQDGWGETYSYGWGGGSQSGGGTASGSNTDNSGSSWGWTQYSGGAWTSGSGSDSTSSSGSYSESISSPGSYGMGWSPFATGGPGLGYGMGAPGPSGTVGAPGPTSPATQPAAGSPFLPDPNQKPPGWNENWPESVDKRGPYTQDPKTGTRYYPHPEDNQHWPHYDTDGGNRYPKNSLKPRDDHGKPQKRPPYGNQSDHDPWDNIKPKPAPKPDTKPPAGPDTKPPPPPPDPPPTIPWYQRILPWLDTVPFPMFPLIPDFFFREPKDGA